MLPAIKNTVMLLSCFCTVKISLQDKKSVLRRTVSLYRKKMLFITHTWCFPCYVAKGHKAVDNLFNQKPGWHLNVTTSTPRCCKREKCVCNLLHVLEAGNPSYKDLTRADEPLRLVPWGIIDESWPSQRGEHRSHGQRGIPAPIHLSL